MWLLHFLPDTLLLWVINIILLAGIIGTVAGFFVKFIPFVNTYRLPVQVVSIILLALGLYFKGGYGVEMEWRERVRELESKVREAEAKSETANAVIQTKIVKQVEYIKDVQYVVQEVIKEQAVVIDAECKVSPVAIDILNAAARNEKPEVKK